MIQAVFLTKSDIAKAQKKLAEVHKFFKGGERDAIYDFASCLRKRLRFGSAKDFFTACEQAAEDLRDKTKVPEVYDGPTISFVVAVSPFIAENLFGRSFAKEVENYVFAPVGAKT